MTDTKPYLFVSCISVCMRAIILGTRVLVCCIINLINITKFGFCKKLSIFCALLDLLLYIILLWKVVSL